MVHMRQVRTVLGKNDFGKSPRESMLDRSRVKISPFRNLTTPTAFCVCGGSARSWKKARFRMAHQKSLLRPSCSKFLSFHNWVAANWLADAPSAQRVGKNIFCKALGKKRCSMSSRQDVLITATTKGLPILANDKSRHVLDTYRYF